VLGRQNAMFAFCAPYPFSAAGISSETTGTGTVTQPSHTMSQASTPIAHYVVFVRQLVPLSAFCQPTEWRRVFYRLLYLHKWFGEPAAGHSQSGCGFPPDVEDTLWTQIQVEWQSPHCSPILVDIRRLCLQGRQAFERRVAERWVPELTVLCHQAYLCQRRMRRLVDAWKVRAARPGTVLYANLTEQLANGFYSTALRLGTISTSV